MKPTVGLHSRSVLGRQQSVAVLARGPCRADRVHVGSGGETATAAQPDHPSIPRCFSHPVEPIRDLCVCFHHRRVTVHPWSRRCGTPSGTGGAEHRAVPAVTPRLGGGPGTHTEQLAAITPSRFAETQGQVCLRLPLHVGNVALVASGLESRNLNESFNNTFKHIQ